MKYLVCLIAYFSYSISTYGQSTIPAVDFILFRVDAQTYIAEEYFRFQQPIHKSLPQWPYIEVGFQFIDYDPPSDYGHITILSSLTSLPVFHASLVYQGIAYPSFPPDSLSQITFHYEQRIQDPTYIDYWVPYDEGSAAAEAGAAFAGIKDTDVVNELIRKGHPYAAFMFRLDHSYWWVLVHNVPPAPKDVGLQLLWPQNVITKDVPSAAEVTVHNYGSTPEDLSVELAVYQLGQEVFSTKETVQYLPPDSSKLLALMPWEPTIQDSFYFEARVATFTGNQPWQDVYNDNNIASTKVSISPYPVFKVVSSYQDTGWIPLNAQPVDFDGDHDLDFFTYGVKPRLLKNLGNKQIVDITEHAGVHFSSIHPRMVIFEDFTGDGLTDFIVVYFGSAQYFEKIGEDSYHDVTDSRGLREVHPLWFGAAFDKENDGDLDLIFNQMGNEIVLENDGFGKFHNVDVGIDDRGQTESFAVGDINNDGYTDLFLVNWESSHALYRNKGNGSFEIVQANWGGGYGRKAKFVDFNNDGLLDIFLAKLAYWDTPSLVFQNNGNLQFVEVSEQIGLHDRSFNVDGADFDSDGDVDMLLDSGIHTNENGEKFVLHTELFNIWERYPYNITTFQFVDLDGDNDLDVYSAFTVFENMGLPLTTRIRNEESASAPSTLHLFQNYPNPFSTEGRAFRGGNLSTTIRYQLTEHSRVSLTIFNIIGEEVVRLLDMEQPAGEYTIKWDGKSSSGRAVTSGIYLYLLKTEKARLVKKMLLVRSN